MIIDTHSHMHSKEFDQDRAEAIARAREAGVERIVLIGENVEDTNRALLAAEENDIFRVIAGVHPHKAGEWNDAVSDSVAELSRHPKVLGIGETGLDYHYDFAPRDKQREAFLGHLEIADRLNVPFVIHCREAYDDCLEILESRYGTSDSGTTRGVMHCYFGTLEQAHRSIRVGLMLGIGGSSTFKKAEELHRVITEIPLDALVLETDAPYMAPVPFRGKRNESSYLTHVVKRIAYLRGMTEAEVIAVSHANALRLYPRL